MQSPQASYIQSELTALFLDKILSQ